MPDGEERLRDIMLAAGVPPTPEGLARVCNTTIAEACAVFQLLRQPPAPLLNLTKASASLRARLIWIIAGESVPQVVGTMSPTDREVLEVAESLEDPHRRIWIAIGKSMLVR